MTRQRLESLSPLELQELATRLGVRVDDGAITDGVVDQIVEALEEEREEQLLSNNPAMSVEGTKYDILGDPEFSSQEKNDYELPDNYNETRIILLLRDPLWAYAYWDIRKSETELLMEDPQFEELFLRVHELDPGDMDGETVDYFDIPLQLEDDSWYITLPKSGVGYGIDLMVRRRESERVLARSNKVMSPRGTPAVDGVSQEDPRYKILELGDSFDSGESSFSETIPQRVIPIRDSLTNMSS